MKKASSKPSPLRRLRREGFDLSTYYRSQGETYYRPRCSQCQVLVIQGVACHETGCPNSKKTHGR